MKAISVRQPWAWAILFAHKDVENRTRNIAGSYRGPLVIHASKTIDADEFVDALRFFDELGVARPQGKVANLGFGVALGVVELCGAHRPSVGDFGPDEGPACSPWGMDAQWHLELANPRPFPEPIPYRGALGLWEFPNELLPEGFR